LAFAVVGRWWREPVSRSSASPAGTSSAWTPEEIAENYGHLSLAQVHTALAYYHANRQVIDGYLAEEEGEARKLESIEPERSGRSPIE
jgi:hypothetical protein